MPMAKGIPIRKMDRMADTMYRTRISTPVPVLSATIEPSPGMKTDKITQSAAFLGATIGWCIAWPGAGIGCHCWAWGIGCIWYCSWPCPGEGGLDHPGEGGLDHPWAGGLDQPW